MIPNVETYYQQWCDEWGDSESMRTTATFDLNTLLKFAECYQDAKEKERPKVLANDPRDTAFLAWQFPTNPRPFVLRLQELTTLVPMDDWKTDIRVKAILHLLCQQVYHQLYTLEATTVFQDLVQSDTP